MADRALGTRIRRERERKRWTQQQLAAELKVGVRTVGSWERGETVPRSSIGALEAVLGVSLDSDEQPEIYTDPAEAELWELTSFTADERRELIRAYREKRLRRAG